MRSLRARATIKTLRMRPPAFPSRSENHREKSAVRLIAQPQPGELDNRRSQSSVACLRDPLLMAEPAACKGGIHQARIGPERLGRAEGAHETFADQHGRCLHADAA